MAYDSQDPIERLAWDLAGQSHAPQQWLVVDNAPISAPLRRTSALQAVNANLQPGQEGAGFGAGCNQAFAELSAAGWDGWVWLLNPDTRLPSVDLLVGLAAVLADLPACALLGTAVWSEQGHLEASGGWIDPGLRFRRRCLNAGHVAVAEERPLAVDWLSGCSLALQPGAHTPAARFDSALPLYYEDMDLCLRLGQGGAPVLWSAALSVQHERGSGSGGGSARRLRLSTISYWRFLQRHCPAWVRWLRGLRLLAGALLRLPSQPAHAHAALQGWLAAWKEPIQ
ncbi:MAG: hypothetical protein RLZZ516_2144 [Cyanobacteriota bacterium]